MSAFRGAWGRRLSWLGYWNMASPSAAGECSTEYGVLDREKDLLKYRGARGSRAPTAAFHTPNSYSIPSHELNQDQLYSHSRSCTANC